ncbi:MAG: metal-sulfur cluster assembly factor [Piscinibacter sp.]|uniref:metal-sulfur cluster assembly factor n=1 Tax=Piscinibacter TaxID=1114981 RepID=UPI0013E3A58D|nr:MULTISPECIES: metal-sulfur cluster assembly factor [Piscinibacter]MCW5667689.1 metal-sulfur cluster assembly factor [Piscinibacter sp.]
MDTPRTDDHALALQALSAVLDPEIGENIVELGLVERLLVDPQRIVLRLVLTSPTCPLGGAIAEDAQRALAQALPGRQIDIDEADEVMWTPERLSAAARRRLGWDDDQG